MSHTGVSADVDGQPRSRRRGRRKKRKKRRIGSFFAVILSLGVIGGILAGIYYGGNAVLNSVGGVFGDAEDYPGPGSGEATVTIEEGSSIRAMGAALVEADIVASEDAFIEAAEANPGVIQPGTYTMAQQMSAKDAVAALIEGEGVLGRVSLPEGLRTRQILERVADETEFKVAELKKALENVDLPKYAKGDPEGFLFPARYDLGPDQAPVSLLNSMIGRFDDVQQELDLIAKAKNRDMTLRQVVTVASIVQREVRNEEDMPRVADVIYNRISGACASAGVPNGILQMDSTVHYAVDDYSSVFTTKEMREVDSPYNTYKNGGLPPGPISSPGEAALSAAVNPSDEGNCYFVTVNVESGETKFADNEADHLANVDELQEYCRENDDC